MVYKLDNKDRKILYELDLNARQSFSEISKKVKLSKEVVNYRVRRMEKLGIIKGYYTLVNMSRLGYICNRFLVNLKNNSPEEEGKIIDFFVRNPKYWWIDSADGFTDLGIGSWEKNIRDCHKRKEEFLERFKPFTGSLNQSIYTGFYIYRRAYLAGKKTKDTRVINYITEKRTKIDKIDISILQILSANARVRVVDIANKLNISVAVVNYRIKKLLKMKVIECFRAMIDLLEIGYYWYKVEFMLKDYSIKNEMLNYFGSHPHIVYAYESTARADLEVELEVESYEKFREVLNQIRMEFKEAIESYRHLLWYKEHKILFFPVSQ